MIIMYIYNQLGFSLSRFVAFVHQSNISKPCMTDLDLSGSTCLTAALPSQTTGEAQYTDDMMLPSNALHAALVTSSKPHARITAVDASPALALPGVVGYYDHRHVPGIKTIGPVVQDEEVFASQLVTCVGQVIGA